MLAVKQREGGDAWQLGETELFMIFDGQRAPMEEVLAAFNDTRSKGAQDEDADPGGPSKGKPAKRAKRSARVHVRKLIVAYTEETFAARRRRQKVGFMGINQMETVFCVTSSPSVGPAIRENKYHGKGTTLGPGLSQPPSWPWGAVALAASKPMTASQAFEATLCLAWSWQG